MSPTSADRPGRTTADRPGRLAVGVVGAGRVGSVLGAALARAGHRVVATSAVSSDSVSRARRRLPGVPLRPADEVVEAADLVLLAVPDDALAPLVNGLAEVGGWRPGQLVMHVSGAHGLAVLEPATRAGALPLALHPIMTFAGRDEDDARLAGVGWGVTAPDALRPIAEALVVEMGGEPLWITEERRPLYHAALAVAANHLVTLIGDARDILREAGVAEPSLALAPLVGAALDNALRSGDAALTGPVVRGDASTVAAHVAALRDYAPETVVAYLAMARRTADRAMTAGRLEPADAETLLAALAAEPNGRRA